MDKPFVSFIITCYDLPVRMLAECIDSILRLSLRPNEREIIVVDDGSEKSPVSDLTKYGDDIIYIRQRHQGLSAARNTGIQMARGEYLQFVDGDDQLVLSAYDHCIDLIRLSHPEMVVFNFTKTAREDKVCQDSPLQSGNSYMRHHNIHGTACGYLFSRTILGDLRFTPGIYHEDEEFTPLLLLRAESICVTDAEAYLYQTRPNSIITDSHIRKKIQRLSDLRDIILRLNTTADRLPADNKTALQEYLQAQGFPSPEYRTVAEEGPAHLRVFTVAVYSQQQEIGQGSGNSKKKAEQAAAGAALKRLNEAEGQA